MPLPRPTKGALETGGHTKTSVASKLLKPGFCDRQSFEHKTGNKNVRFLMQRNRKSKPQEIELQTVCAIPNAKSGFQQFAKRAVASVSGGFVRKPLGQLREADLVKLDAALRLWFGL